MVPQSELPVGQSMSNFGSLSAEAEHKENDFLKRNGPHAEKVEGSVLQQWQSSRSKNVLFHGDIFWILCSIPPDEQQM